MSDNTALFQAWERLTAERDALRDELAAVRASRAAMDCRFTPGDVADISGSHCSLDAPCDRCRAEDMRDALVKCEFALTLLLGGCPSQTAEEEAVMAARAALKVEGT